MTAPCARCGRPTDATICQPEARTLAEQLTTAAGHAEDAEAVITRQVRYGSGGPRAGEERPIPTNLAASARYRRIETTIGTWAHTIENTTGSRVPAPAWPSTNITATAARYLATHVEDLRKHPDAAKAFTDLTAACDDLARLNDRPADNRRLVGVCDCGRVLYAREDQVFVKCPDQTCQLKWNVEESRDILRAALRERIFTASECARLAAFWNERTQPQIRALITSWTAPKRTRLVARGWIPNDDYTGAEDDDQPAGWATYLLGDVLDLLAATPRRHREGAAA